MLHFSKETIITMQERFDALTLANMELALDLACSNFYVGEQHEARSHIALRILETAQRGYKTLEALTDAGMIAASELSLTHGS